MDRVRRQRPRERPSSIDRMLRDPSLGVAAAAGVATHIPGLFYLVALNAIAASQPGIGEAIVDVLVYNAIWFSVPIAALLVARQRPGAARELIERVDGWIRRHQDGLLALVFAAVGVYLTAKGVSGLAS
jgi:Sap, sulfolipid-1-addressing protein